MTQESTAQPELDARDWLVGHRACPAHWPENSISGMIAAAEAGARFLECDVQLSSDGVPMVAHDDPLDRVGGKSFRVTRQTAAELENCPIGEPRRFGEQFASERLPTLQHLLHVLAAWPETNLFIEIKVESLDCFGHDAVLNAVHQVMQTAAIRCIPISFDANAVEQIRNAGAAEIGWVLPKWNETNRKRADELQPDYLFVDRKRIPPGPNPFWPDTNKWAIYVVDDITTAQKQRTRGATLIETDRITGMLEDWEETVASENSG